jgi:ABC-2 type transport system ATP-binding protein
MNKVMATAVAESLSKSYGSFKAVNDINLTLNEGTITGLIGPNGAGKTTTIKMILGLLKPDRGKFFYWLKRVSSASGSDPI